MNSGILPWIFSNVWSLMAAFAPFDKYGGKAPKETVTNTGWSLKRPKRKRSRRCRRERCRLDKVHELVWSGFERSRRISSSHVAWLRWTNCSVKSRNECPCGKVFQAWRSNRRRYREDSRDTSTGRKPWRENSRNTWMFERCDPRDNGRRRFETSATARDPWSAKIRISLGSLTWLSLKRPSFRTFKMKSLQVNILLKLI